MGSITKLLSETVAVPAVSVRPGGLSAVPAATSVSRPAYAASAAADARRFWGNATSDVRPSFEAICTKQRGNGMEMSTAGFGTHGYPSWRDWI